MKTVSAILFALATASAAFAQDVKESDVRPATRRYHELRMSSTEPSFGLAKVKAAIKAIKVKDSGKNDDSEVSATPLWSRFSVPEKFTYTMLHGEQLTQNCDMMPWVVDEEHKVFAYPPPFNEGQENWSDRQSAFLKTHRGEVIRLLRSTIRKTPHVGTNLKAAVVQIEGVELIPDLIAAYKRGPKDQDLLTVMMLLMKDGKYKPFLESITFRKLYGPDANYQSFIVANEANQRLMFDRATAFYRSRVH